MLHLVGAPKGGKDIPPPYGSYSLGAAVGASGDADKGAHIRGGQEREEVLLPQHPLDNPGDGVRCSLGPSAQRGWLPQMAQPGRGSFLRRPLESCVSDTKGLPFPCSVGAPYTASGPPKAHANPRQRNSACDFYFSEGRSRRKTNGVKEGLIQAIKTYQQGRGLLVFSHPEVTERETGREVLLAFTSEFLIY